MAFHPDVVANEMHRQMESKRSGMAITYGDRLEKLVESIKAEDHKDHAKFYQKYKKMLFVLNEKSIPKGCNMGILENIEGMLKRSFNKPPASIRAKGKPIEAIVDLTIDDDDEVAQVPMDPSAAIPASSSINSEASSSPTETFYSCGSVPASPLPAASPPVIQPVPLPDTELPTASTLGLPEFELPESEPLDKDYTQDKQRPQRRKSTNQRPKSSKDLPSISEYHIKHKVLPPPNRYAKPKENEADTPRKIIELPFKPVKAKPETYDPAAEAIKLAGIREKIYVSKFLRISEARKEDIEAKAQQKMEKEKTALEEEVPQEAETEETVLEEEFQKEAETEAGPSRPNKVRTAHTGKAKEVKPVDPKPNTTKHPEQVAKKRGRPKNVAEPGKRRIRSKSVCYKDDNVDMGENADDFTTVNAPRLSMDRRESLGLTKENKREESHKEQPIQKGTKQAGQSTKGKSDVVSQLKRKSDSTSTNLSESWHVSADDNQEPPMKFRRKSVETMNLRQWNRMRGDDHHVAPDHDPIALQLAEMMQETNNPVASPSPNSTVTKSPSTTTASSSIETSSTASPTTTPTTSPTTSTTSSSRASRSSSKRSTSKAVVEPATRFTRKLDKMINMPDDDDRIHVIYHPNEVLESKIKAGKKGRGKSGPKGRGKSGPKGRAKGKPGPKPKSKSEPKPKGKPGRKKKIDLNSRQVAPSTPFAVEPLEPLPENFFDDFDFNDGEDGESLLVEVAGFTIQPKRDVYEPKNPRGKVPQVVIKIEPQE